MTKTKKELIKENKQLRKAYEIIDTHLNLLIRKLKRIDKWWDNELKGGKIMEEYIKYWKKRLTDYYNTYNYINLTDKECKELLDIINYLENKKLKVIK